MGWRQSSRSDQFRQSRRFQPIRSSPGTALSERAGTWEFYNEPDDWTAADQGQPPPNDHRGWGGHEDQYASTLKTAYEAIHAGGGDRSQYVVFGGIAYEPWWPCPTRPKGQCFDNDFVENVLAAANGTKIFDVMNYHYYAAFAQYHQPPNILGKAVELTRTFPALQGLPFVITEMGTPYGGGDPSNNYSHDLASDQVIKMYAQLLSGADPEFKVNILAGMWFPLEQFEEPVPPNPPQLWGLLDGNGKPWTLEANAFANSINELGGRYMNRISDIPGLEGYNFLRPDGSIQAVLWTTSGGARGSFPTLRLRRLDKRGETIDVSDNGPRDNDPRSGWIGLDFSPSPTFVEYRVIFSLSGIFGVNPVLNRLLKGPFLLVCQTYRLPCSTNSFSPERKVFRVTRRWLRSR